MTQNKMVYLSCSHWRRYKTNRIPSQVNNRRNNLVMPAAIIHLIKRVKMLTLKLERISQTGNYKVKLCELLWDKLRVFKLTVNMTKQLFKKPLSKMIMLDVTIVVVDSTKKLLKGTLPFVKQSLKKIKSNMDRTIRLKRVAL